MQIDKPRVAQLIDDLLRITGELSAMTKRSFAPDGHLVGSIGEVLAANAYDLELMPHSTKGYDAVKGAQKIEIKATFATSVAFRRYDSGDVNYHCLVLRLRGGCEFDEIYNGPIAAVLQALSSRDWPSNGQKQIRLTQLRKLNEIIDPGDRLSRNDQ